MAAVAAVDMAVVARKGRRRRRQTLWRDLGVTVHSTTACVFSCSSIKMGMDTWTAQSSPL
eukprot:33623_6